MVDNAKMSSPLVGGRGACNKSRDTFLAEASNSAPDSTHFDLSICCATDPQESTKIATSGV